MNAAAFTESFIHCEGILCGAGFETPAEALHMQKKLLVVPMKQQYEQHCNAAGAASLGVPVIKSLKKKHIEKVENWLNNKQHIPVDYKDETNMILDQILQQYQHQSIPDSATQNLSFPSGLINPAVM